MKKILAIETSCDDTCVGIVNEDGFVQDSIKQNQDLIHRPFGGVVPERASRDHSFHLLPAIDQILKNEKDPQSLVGLACTTRPGLMGSLLVGSVTAQTLGVLWKKPVIGVNHIEGHILSPFIYDHKNKKDPNWNFPYIVLVISGGHTHLFEVKDFFSYNLIGMTLDDAAGEAFDKFARLLNLNYPGGVEVDKISFGGDPKMFSFPRALLQKGNLNFSFSGLKTSARVFLEKKSQKDIQKHLSSLCASFQDAVVDQIIFKLEECRKKYPHYKNWAVTGGVSANSWLRKKCQKWADKTGLQLRIPALQYCTDNAAMIGYAGIQRWIQNKSSSADLRCSSDHFQDDFFFQESM